MTHDELKKLSKAQLVKRCADLERNLEDTIWMARRYAHMRSSYAVGMLNDSMLWCIQNGVEVKPDFAQEDALVFARDGMAATVDAFKLPQQLVDLEVEYAEAWKRKMRMPV